MAKSSGQRMTTLHPQAATTRWTDYLPFVPIALCIAVVFSLPGASDQQSVDQVQAGIVSAANALMQLAGAGEVPVSGPLRHASSAMPQAVRVVRPNTAQQQWENHPSSLDHSSGRFTRLSFGSAERGSLLRGR